MAAHPEDPDPTPTMLRWPRASLTRELAAQVREGYEIAGTLGGGGGTRLADGSIIFTTTAVGPGQQGGEYDRDRDERWRARNREILTEAFTTTEVLDQYEPPPMKVDPLLVALNPNPRVVELSVDDSRAIAHDEVRALTGRLGLVLARLELYEEAAPHDAKVFLVHGRDNGTKETVARVLRMLLGAEPVILHEQLDRGAVLIEKFERHAGEASAAVVILSPDDVGRLASGTKKDLRPRARQNVVYELGWFHGKLQRGRVIALVVGDVEQPSDLDGVLYLLVKEGGDWRLRLGFALRDMGFNADLHNLPPG